MERLSRRYFISSNWTRRSVMSILADQIQQKIRCIWMLLCPAQQRTLFLLLVVERLLESPFGISWDYFLIFLLRTTWKISSYTNYEAAVKTTSEPQQCHSSYFSIYSIYGLPILCIPHNLGALLKKNQLFPIIVSLVQKTQIIIVFSSHESSFFFFFHTQCL